MGYAKSIDAFSRGKPWLDLLKASKEPIVLVSGNAKKLQYIIHNALFVACYLHILPLPTAHFMAHGE